MFKSIMSFVAVSFISVSAFAAVLTPLTNQEQQINVTTVEAVESLRSSDDVVGATVTTVFRGSAMGFSSAFVTFADSLEDAAFTFEFDTIIGKPVNVSILKNQDGSYKYTMTVKRVEMGPKGGFNYYDEVINLKVTKVKGDYIVEQK